MALVGVQVEGKGWMGGVWGDGGEGSSVEGKTIQDGVQQLRRFLLEPLLVTKEERPVGNAGRGGGEEGEKRR